MYCYADHVANTSCTASHIWCYAAVISSCTSSHIWCYAAVISSCTSSHIWCYAAVILSCTASHIWCYAAVISSCTSSHIWCYAAIISSCTASHIWCYAAVISSCTSSHIWCYAAIISSCTASHIWCYATSEPSTEIAVRSESNEVQMGVLLYVETQRQVWKHAEFKDFERHLVALSEKDAVRKLFTLYRLQKKRKIFHFFWDIRMSKMSVSLRRNAHFQITPNENLKNQMFFFSPLMTKISISLRRNTNFHFGVMRLPSKNDHDFEMSFYKVPQIPRFQLLTWKS